MALIDSRHMNLLVYRYLQDTGFLRSVTVFVEEAGLDPDDDGDWIPDESLETLVEERLKFLKMKFDNERAKNSIIEISDSDTSDETSDLKMKDAAGMRDFDNNIAKKIHKGRRSKSRRKSLDHMTLRERMEGLREQGSSRVNDEKNESMIVDADHSGTVIELEGHVGGIMCCAWSPEGRRLASGSGDWTAGIWIIADGTSSSSLGKHPLHVLKHDEAVTALDWNLDGTLLATGSRDGKARVWNRDGELLYTRCLHKETISSLKWNRMGDCILTGSNDNTAVVWDIEELSEKQFMFHTGPVIDVDWMDDYTFATCSSDHMIYAFRVTKSHPIRTFAGHEGVVNCVKWDSSRKLLASCSKDKTIKIWSMDRGKYVKELKGHAEEMDTIQWSPIRPDTNRRNSPPILASASLDSTVKLWNVKKGNCIYSLDEHSDAVVAISFSPDGEYLATGSLDKSLRIWHIKRVKVIFTYNASDAISGVSWSKEGDKIAVWFFNSQIVVLDAWR